jgi:IS30 family transposase
MLLPWFDYLSKCPEAFPLYKKEAKEVAEKLSEAIYRFGPPDEIIFDCGGEFNSKVTTELMKNYSIRHITPYHPHANGLVDNFNQTIKSMINKVVSDSGSD